MEKTATIRDNGMSFPWCFVNLCHDVEESKGFCALAGSAMHVFEVISINNTFVIFEKLEDFSAYFVDFPRSRGWGVNLVSILIFQVILEDSMYVFGPFDYGRTEVLIARKDNKFIRVAQLLEQRGMMRQEILVRRLLSLKKTFETSSKTSKSATDFIWYQTVVGNPVV